METPQKRNLIAISVALVIYYLGKGTFEGTPTVVGVIKLGNPDILFYGAWAFFVYSLWQFWLRTAHLRGSYRNSWRQRLRDDPAFHKLVRARFDPSIEPNRVSIDGTVLRRKFRDETPDRKEPVITAQKRWSFTLDRLAWKHILKSAFAETHFSDTVLPYVFALAAVGAAILMSFSE